MKTQEFTLKADFIDYIDYNMFNKTRNPFKICTKTYYDKNGVVSAQKISIYSYKHTSLLRKVKKCSIAGWNIYRCSRMRSDLIEIILVRKNVKYKELQQ